ncbi:MAG: hypothetical protein L0Y72_31140 [Gemmataceae bacterium]|nr:hypothetical protein [Gemmataceae bacterium]MCI0743506.1 hypothetical protein [Gemmataceae bacterium]
MVSIRFTDEAAELKGLGYLAGRFSFKTWDTGQTIVPEAALAHLARAGIRFTVEGPATYDKLIPPFRNPPASAV